MVSNLMDYHVLLETFRAWILSYGETRLLLGVLFVAFFGSIVESLPLIGMLMLMQSLTIFFGILAYEGIVDLMKIWIALVSGMATGDLLAYRIGTHVRSSTIEQLLKHLHLRKDHFTQIKHTLDRHFIQSYFFGRSSGWTRWIVPFLSGNHKINPLRFMFLNLLTALVWTSLFLLGGYFLGFGFKALEKYIFFGIIILILIAYAAHKYKLNTRKK